MSLRVYTKEQLLALRDSPLVCKPENLPAIEAWIDESQQQSQAQRPDGTTARRNQQQRPITGGEASPMGNFSAGSRPGLIQMRSHASRSGEEISLGPPKALFPSSRTVPRLSDFADKTNDSTQAEEPDALRQARGFGDKQTNRKSLNTSESESRHSKESWMQARERRTYGGDEDGGERKFGRRDRDQDSERRNGFGDKPDGRWGAHREDKRPNGERTGGWRERERERQKHDRDRDRDWDRPSKDPEWMDDPIAKQDDDLSTMGMPKNQEDFEKWKQAQHARNKKSTDDAVLELPESSVPAMQQSAAPLRKLEPLKLDSSADKAFGGWGESRRTEPAIESAPSAAPAQPPAKGKSRFMPMFQKDKPKEQAPPLDTVATAPTGLEDDNKAGFDRIMQMLSTTGISQTTTPMTITSNAAPTPLEPTSPPAQSRSTANGQRPKSRFTGFFEQTPKSPERLLSPQSHEPQAAFKQTDNEFHRNYLPESKDASSSGRPNDYTHQRSEVIPQQVHAASQGNVPPSDRREQQSQQNRMHDLFLDPPTRAASTPDNNIQNLLAQRSKGQQGQDKNSDFLLSLLQAKGSARPTSSQAHPDFPLWIDQAKTNITEPHAPKPMIHAKAGVFEDQLLRHGPPEVLRQEQQQGPGRTLHRAPPGFFDDQSLFLQQQQQQGQAQRRAFPEPHQQQGPPPPRRMGGHPGQQVQMAPSAPPQYLTQDFIQSAPGIHPGPPPGFNPHVRHPPGFHNIPNIFEAPQPQQQKPRQAVPPPPAAFGATGMMPGQGPQMANVPPGFFNGPQQAMPPGFMMRQSLDGLPASVRGNGRGTHDVFDMGGQRR